MNPIKTFLKLIGFSIALLLGFTIVTHLPARVGAQPQPPSSQTLPSRWGAYEPDSSIGKPGRREGGGTRGPALTSLTALTALAPPNSRGATLSAYPTFFFYVSKEEGKDRKMTFTLSEKFTLSDGSNQQEIYKTIFTSTGLAGIVSISLPAYANLPPLETGRSYHWTCALSSGSDAEALIRVDGWIWRINPSPELKRDLEQATSLRDRLATYDKNNVWYDTLATLAELRRANPNDAELKAKWTALLESVGLGQNKIPTQSLAQGL
ncbi:DUF928 domain-containing protein [Argonema antarcticum]|uniref:DUF928 domain-containing protein n=1 Tax=Argonema antarcticum TaxID=2942763 RepID=UPI002010F362|nr:DUF928 domain-containing protein [Argonema antarcticum]MCL1475671.1 DUF928 domain-containing protein [Argonema antarcticum A004/B2]